MCIIVLILIRQPLDTMTVNKKTKNFKKAYKANNNKLIIKKNYINKSNNKFKNKSFKDIHYGLKKKFSPNRKNKNNKFQKRYKRKKDKFRFRNRRPRFKHKYLRRKPKRTIKKYWNFKYKEYRFRWVKRNDYFWKKIKKKKTLRNVHNFFFFFAKRRRYYRSSYNGGFLRYQIRIKKSLLEARNFIHSKIKYKMKIRWSKRLKRSHKRKKTLNYMLKHYYTMTSKHMKRLKTFVRKKANRLDAVIWFFEGRISTVCVRSHFFWNIKKATRWIPLGLISINNLRITSHRTIVRINDFINFVGPILIFAHRIMRSYPTKRFHTKFYKCYNHSMVLPRILATIILRLPWKFKEIKTRSRRRQVKWIRFNTFAALTNTFY